MKPRLFIIGATGFIGAHWARAAESVFEVWRGARSAGSGARSVTVDIVDPDSTRAAFEVVRPQFVTLLAALPDIDRAEREPALAEAMNYTGAVHVARACARISARLLFTSTDAVFDGTRGSYREEDPPSPPNWYGHTKAKAEAAVAKLLPTATIARLSLVMGRSVQAPGNSYVEKVAANLRAGNQIISPTYEYRNPIDVGTLCAFLHELTLHERAAGLVHVGASDKMSRYDLARTIARLLSADVELVVAQQAPVPGRAARGRDDFLETDRLQSLCRTPVPTCEQVVARALAGVK